MKKCYVVSLFILDRLTDAEIKWAECPEAARKDATYWWVSLAKRVDHCIIGVHELDLNNLSVTPHGHVESIA